MKGQIENTIQFLSSLNTVKTVYSTVRCVMSTENRIGSLSTLSVNDYRTTVNFHHNVSVTRNRKKLYL